VVVNRAEYRDDALKEYCARAGLEIIGEIPDDRKIAEVYSVGDLVVERLPEYKKVFETLADRMEEAAGEKRAVQAVQEMPSFGAQTKAGKLEQAEVSAGTEKRPRELVIISGKGGTGKTSIAGAFAALAGKTVISDCDVDASDLHLLLHPEVQESGEFSGGVVAEIVPAQCTGCGRCKEACRFEAVETAEVVVTKYDLNREMTEQIKVLAREVDAEIMGTIPYDTKVTEAQMEGVSVVEYAEGHVAEGIKQIWAKINQRG